MKASLPMRLTTITLLAQAFACAAGMGLLGAPRSRATPQLIDPDQESIPVTSYYATFGQVPSKMADNSGLSSPLPTGSPIPASDALYPSHDTALINMYRSGKDTHPDLTFSLNGSYTLSGMHYWNFNADNSASHPSGGDKETPDDGIQTVDVAVADNVFGPYTTIGTYTLNRAPNLDTYTGETVNFGQAVEAQFVRFHVGTNFATPGPDASGYFGLAELRFTGTLAPEPASSMSLIFLGAGVLLRRRRART